MNSILTTALKKLPKSKKDAETRFLLRIVLERFGDNEKRIIASFNKMGRREDFEGEAEQARKDERTKRLWEIMAKMPEFSCRIAFSLWMHIEEGEGYLHIINALHQKFDLLTLQEQLALIEENLDDHSHSDVEFLSSMLARSKVTGHAVHITDHLKKIGDRDSRDEVRALLIVIRSMASETMNIPD